MEIVKFKHAFLGFPFHEKHLFMCLQCHHEKLSFFNLSVHIVKLYVDTYQDT